MPKRKSKSPHFLLIASILLVVGFIVLSGFFYFLGRPVSSDKVVTNFVVRKGAGVDAIGQNLKEKKLIRSKAVFKITVLKLNISKNIQAGSFRISPSMSTSEIAQSLTEGRQDIWVTILEGWRREEIAEAIETSFNEAGAFFDPEIFLSITKGKEGFLFPDTYLFPIDADEKLVASILENTLAQKITDQMDKDINKSGRNLKQILTMASLIEREARSEDSRPLVSGILWKRLDNDWPLQVDATLQYALGYNEAQKTWWKPPTAADKTVKSPYNTYSNPGLPPGPICSPSISSIKAAIYPKSSNYWFYLTDTKGVMHYAETVEQHNNNVNRYLR